jgi:hypothetical protein
MKTSPKVTPELEDEDLKDMTLIQFLKGYFVYLFQFFIRPR